jgi:hypothetical protein
MTDKKLVFLLAVAAGAAVRAVQDGMGPGIAAQTVAYAGTVPDKNLDRLDISEAAEEYMDYCLQPTLSTPDSIPEPAWCKGAR